MKKKLNEEKQIQTEETKDKNNMSEEEFDVYIEKIMNSDETKPEEKKEQKSELEEIKDDLKKLISSLSAMSQSMAYIPHGKQASAEEQKSKMLDAILAQRKRQDAMRRHIFAQAEDLKKTFSDFDLRALYNTSPEFKKEFDRTRSVYGAYLKYIASKLGNMTASKPRFMENGAMPGLTSGSVSASPAGLPDKEFDEYIHSILGDL